MIAIDGSQAEIQAGIDKLAAAFAAYSATYGSVGIPRWSPTNDFAVVDLYLRTDANSQGTRDTIAALRGTVIPAAFSGLSTNVYVTGDPRSTSTSSGLVARGRRSSSPSCSGSASCC